MHKQKLSDTEIHYKIHVLGELSYKLTFQLKAHIIIRKSSIDHNLTSSWSIPLSNALDIP